jgi:hypothetical protein
MTALGQPRVNLAEVYSVDLCYNCDPNMSTPYSVNVTFYL